MKTALLALLLALCAAPLMAQDEVIEFNDFVPLRDHETVRYRIDIDYGSDDEVELRVYVRGFGGPPRVRILDEDYDERREVEDTSGDWEVDVTYVARSTSARYYVEVDSDTPWHPADMDINIRVLAPETQGASADVDFVKVFVDRESNDESDHYDCAAHPGAGAWPLAALVLAGLGAATLRRRRAR